MTQLYLVRHGRAAAGWNTDPDPGLDDIGRAQAAAAADRLAPIGPLPIVTSPLRRCRELLITIRSRCMCSQILWNVRRARPRYLRRSSDMAYFSGRS